MRLHSWSFCVLKPCLQSLAARTPCLLSQHVQFRYTYCFCHGNHELKHGLIFLCKGMFSCSHLGFVTQKIRRYMDEGHFESTLFTCRHLKARLQHMPDFWCITLFINFSMCYSRELGFSHLFLILLHSLRWKPNSKFPDFLWMSAWKFFTLIIFLFTYIIQL